MKHPNSFDMAHVYGKIKRLEKQLDHIEELLCKLVNEDLLIKSPTNENVMVRQASNNIKAQPLAKTKKKESDPTEKEPTLFGEGQIPYN